MSEDNVWTDNSDLDEEFVLTASEVQMLLYFVDGEEDLIDKEKFNSLLTDMAAFVNVDNSDETDDFYEDDENNEDDEDE